MQSNISADVMRNREVISIIFDDATHHKLLAILDLTLDNAVKICRAKEAATLTSNRTPATGTNKAARKSNYQRSKTPTATAKLQPPSEPPKCPNCGRTAHTMSPRPAQRKKKPVLAVKELATFRQSATSPNANLLKVTGRLHT